MKKQRKPLTTSYTNLYFEAKRRYNELLLIKKSKEAALEKVPPGKICVSRTMHGVQYYLRKDTSDKSGRYVRKNETTPIKQHLQKAYDEKVLKIFTAELQGLRVLLQKAENAVNKVRKAYSAYPAEVKKLITPVDVSDEDYIREWMEETYEGKPIPDYLPFWETKRRERVRSKSELNIANALADRGIPYKYECPLQLSNGETVYPDFTVLNVKKRKVLYWEHRGMMDDKEYAKGAVLRLKELMKEGLFVGEELIITEETSANPLGTNEIDAVIRRFLL
ncbi:MAG: hypothetical protein K6B39_09315 [Lachnospiraceae bacterium]|nr:hypothetical protein [Lachnospiraceae bacterium]